MYVHEYCPPAGYPTPPPPSCGCNGSGSTHGNGVPNDAPPLPQPVAMMRQPGGAMSLGEQLGAMAGAALNQLAGDMQTRKICGPWKDTRPNSTAVDPWQQHRACCTPPIGKGGHTASLCFVQSRPRQTSTQPVGGDLTPWWPTPG